MAPFPETEIMTIKRLEVALRKQDFKLLKDGAYKLHEKYHSGYKFEYIDLLKEIFVDIQNNPAVPKEIKDILIPTIDDILNNSNPAENPEIEPQNRVSSLTSLSYVPKNEDTKKAAFEAFIAPKTKEIPQLQVQMQTNIQSPFSAEPFKEFSTPKVVSAVNSALETRVEPEIRDISSQTETLQEQNSNFPNKVKTVSIFYGENPADSKNILEYREILKNGQNDFLKTLCEINSQINTDVSELKGFINQFVSRDENVNLITDSKSSMIIDLLNQFDVSYSLFGLGEGKKINLTPLFGLSNLFKCNSCGYEHLNSEKGAHALVLQCPKCKKMMFPNLYYAQNANCEINLEYYNSAVVSLVGSEIWFLIHPFSNEKITSDLLVNSLKIARDVREIFILDNDANNRETLKNMLLKAKPDVKINVQISAVENFFNSK